MASKGEVNLRPLLNSLQALKFHYGALVDHLPCRPALANRFASSAARNSALALLMHSCCSNSGSESATTPAPAWTYMTPSLIKAVRSTMQESISSPAEK